MRILHISAIYLLVFFFDASPAAPVPDSCDMVYLVKWAASCKGKRASDEPSAVTPKGPIQTASFLQELDEEEILGILSNGVSVMKEQWRRSSNARSSLWRREERRDNEVRRRRAVIQMDEKVDLLWELLEKQNAVMGGKMRRQTKDFLHFTLHKCCTQGCGQSDFCGV